MMVRGRELPRSAWWTVGAIVVCLAVLTSVGIWYTHVANREQDRQWCELLDVLSVGYRAAPQLSPEAQRVADAIERLRVRKGCTR